MTAPTLAEIYTQALREIVEALGSDRPDAAQTALEIAADALADGDFHARVAAEPEDPA